MKKTLLFVLMCVCATVSAWAQDYSGEAKTWISCDNSSVQETAFIFTINTPGKLSEALASTQSTYQIAKIKGELNAEDIATLSSITAETIDLQDAYYMENGEKKAFTFTNSSVRNLILPDNWTKAEVNAAAQAVNANLGSAISLGTFKDADGSDFASGSTFAGKTEITAYVNTSKTLRDVLIRTYSEGNNTKFASSCNKDNFTMDNVYGITISGYAVAQDFSKTSLDFTAEGHLVFDREANEKERNKANDARTIVGTGSSKVPAFSCNTLGSNRVVSLDLSGVIIDDANNSDLTLSELDIVGAATRQVCIPTCSSLKTLPADFLNVNGIGVNQICIPGNIQVIKTRAFQNVRLDHVWTTGNAEDIRYDNGIYVLDNNNEEVMHEGYLSYASPNSSNMDNTYYLYGTYTLPEYLKLIESNAFCYENDAKVKDVYVLAIVTPECHVDAFSTIMYTGNNTFDATAVSTEGIVTREAYVQNKSRHNYIAMLHYPRECGTPYIQRYTDPTRDYSIATGLVDGKGATIYFPNQNEFLRAYTQGTYGYVWNAWDPTRSTNGSNEIANIKSENPYTQAGQIQANNLYTSNNVFTAKSDRTFYDTTDGGNVEKPAGQGNYWDVEWEGQQLYPQAVSTTPNPSYVYVRDDNGLYVMEVTTTKTGDSYSNSLVIREYNSTTDAGKNLERYSIKKVVETDNQGNIIYVQDSNGDYVQDFEWVADDDGEFVKVIEQHGYASTNVIVDGVTTYYTDENGTVANTLELGSGQYYECGTADEYTKVDTNNDVPGAQSVYYITNDGGQTYEGLTNLPLSGNPTLYTRSNEPVTKYSPTTKLKYGVTHYFDADGNEVIPTLTLDNPNTGTLYYMDSENVRHDVTDMKFVQGQGNYYVEFTYGGSQQVNDNYPSVSLNGTYYYEDGVDYQYTQAQNFTPGTTYYTENNGNYSEATIQWYMINGGGQNLYYVSGSRPTYCDTEGQTYDPSKTYYSDANGTTVATTIHLNNTYYIPNYVEVYRAPESGEEGLQHYSKNPLGTYRLATAADAGEQRWSPSMVNYISETPITYTKQNDYRGWHQFVLTGYAHNKNYEMEPYRSYITDNDWWTVCLPFDLTYNDMVLFFGSEGGEVPYLSKLTYVVRDVAKEKITLMFSKNLMKYKETVASGHVHGTISDTESAPAANDVVLHQGVPYLIKPNLKTKIDNNGQVVIDADRSFDIKKEIYHTSDGDNCLYCRLHESNTMNGLLQMDIIHKGIYTVPAYVINNTGDKAETYFSENLTIALEDGSSNTYANGKLTFKGIEYDAVVSDKFTYSFVGSLYLSLMPQYSYFLGWDSNNNCAAFWYNRVNNKQEYTWNNNTGIICANWLTLPALDPTKKRIHKATKVADPARWTDESDGLAVKVSNDDFGNGSGTSNAKSYTMDFGGECIFVDPVSGITTSVQTLPTQEMELVQSVYTANGVYVGKSVKGLSKGVYIVNGKKYVVK